MTFREKAKGLFKTKSRGNSLSKTDTNGSTTKGRHPSNVYKPGEMPQPKYRRPPNKEHKEKLEAFDFNSAWGRSSFQSTYSPMGTRAQSRRTSWFSLGRKSVGGKSISGKSDGARANSATSVDTEKSDGKSKEGINTVPSILAEQDGDDDVANVGMSRVQSRDHKPVSRPKTAEDNQPNGLHKTPSTAPDHQPFSERDFENALHRSHLHAAAQA